jgi:hypothetical protein
MKAAWDEWGYAFRDVRGVPGKLSNHASGTAIDLNATKHPLGKVGTFPADKVPIIRALAKKYRLAWGGDYRGRVDEMHFEVCVNAKKAAKRILKLSKEGNTRGRAGSTMNKKQLEAAAYSYGRAALASVAALYLSGITDPKVLANAFIAGLIGPFVKALQPNEKQYGIGSKE